MRRGWVEVLTGALITLVVVFVAIMVINGVVIPPLVVFAVVFAVLAWAVQRWRDKRWLFILTAVLAVVALLANLPFVIEDLAHPETFATFVPTVVAIVASLVATGAAVAAAMRVGPGAARPVGLGAVSIVALAMITSAVATASAGDDERVEGDVIVLAEDVEFPERLEASAGRVGFFIENHDRIRHTFVIVDQDVKLELPADRDRRLEVELTAGTYEFLCDVPGHERMNGTIEVR